MTFDEGVLKLRKGLQAAEKATEAAALKHRKDNSDVTAAWDWREAYGFEAGLRKALSLLGADSFEA